MTGMPIISKITKEMGIAGVVVGTIIVAGIIAYDKLKKNVIFTITGKDTSNPLDVKLFVTITNASKKKVKYVVYHVECGVYKSKKYTISSLEPLTESSITITLDNPPTPVEASFDLEGVKLKVDKIDYY